MQSKAADPHDISAIESILAARTDRAPPLVHDPHAPAAGPHINIAPEISVGSPIPRIEPDFRVEEKAKASEVAIVPADDIKVDKPPSRWGRRVVMALLGLIGAIGAAGWQHYSDHAKDNMKAMAANWTPAFVMAALMPSEKSAAAEPSAAPVEGQAAAQAAIPAPVEQATATAAAPAPETTQLQSMAHDLAAMGQQVEELKATIAQLKASQAQLTRDLAKSQEAKAAEAKPAAPRLANAAPGSPMAASAALPRPVAAAAPPPVRKPKPVAPAQAAYVPPPPPPPVQLQSAPPQALADDGAPLVRPPMPLR